MSPISPRRGLRLLSVGLSGPGVLRGVLQEPVTEKGARAEGTLPFISQPASSLSLRQLRGSQPRGERETKDGAGAAASGLPSSLIRSPPLRRSLHPSLTAARRDRILKPESSRPLAELSFPIGRGKVYLASNWLKELFVKIQPGSSPVSSPDHATPVARGSTAVAAPRQLALLGSVSSRGPR